jgi:hypothetical protein
MRLVRARTETADRREPGGGMSSKKDLIHEEREEARRNPEMDKRHIPSNEFVFSSRLFALFADKDL